MQLPPILLRFLCAIGNALYANTPYALALMYHDTSGANDRYSVSMETLSRHIDDLLRRGFRFVPAEDIAQWKPTDGKVCALTFDDGYASNLDLKDIHQPVTIFLSTEPNPIEINSPFPLDARLLATDLGKRMHVHFGAHGVSHLRWTKLQPADLEEELAVSKRTIEEWTDRKVACCSYPKGSMNDAVREAAARHFSCAFLADGAPITRPVADRMMIPRVGIFGSTSMEEFRLRTNPVFRHVLTLYRLWKRF